MTDDRETAADTPLGPVGPTGEPLDDAQLLPPEQPPMDDAAGGPQAESDEDFAAAAPDGARKEPSGRGGA